MKDEQPTKRFKEWYYVIVLLLIIGILCGLTFLLNACVAFFTQGIQLLFNGGTFFLYN